MTRYPRLDGMFYVCNWALSLSYWPIWLVFVVNGHTWLGMLAGAGVFIGGEILLWRYTWGEWLWSSEKSTSHNHGVKSP